MTKPIHFLLLSLLSVIVGGSDQSILASSPADRSPLPSATPSPISPSPMYIQQVTLQAREETHPPLGETPQPQRDLGFTAVFLKLENPQQVEAEFTLQTIVIQTAAEETLQPFSYKPQVLHLHPLEKAEQAIYLTNKTGFWGEGKIRAIVTYTVKQQHYEVISEPVTVDRF